MQRISKASLAASLFFAVIFGASIPFFEPDERWRAWPVFAVFMLILAVEAVWIWRRRWPQE